MIELLDIRSRVVNILQDSTYVRWTKTELNNYIHDALLDLIRITRLPVADKNIDISPTSFLIPLPVGLMDVSGGSILGRELPVVTTSEMKRLASDGNLPVVVKEGEHSITHIFGNSVWSSSDDWRSTVGKTMALVLDQRSSETVRVWPIPIEDAVLVLTGTARPTRMSDEVPSTYSDATNPNSVLTRNIVTPLNGWVTGSNLIDDSGQTLTLNEADQTVSLGDITSSLTGLNFTTQCPIDGVWIDALTFGTLERAYLKEHDLRNVEKSEYFRNKKMSIIADADRIEPLNPASIAGGVNFNRLVVRR
jgi:hypothetical protein